MQEDLSACYSSEGYGWPTPLTPAETPKLAVKKNRRYKNAFSRKLRHIGLKKSDMLLMTAMLRLSKKVEYGLIALQHLARRGSVATVREISEEYNISYDLLAKIMQDLKREGVIDSYQGVRGGYALMLAPASISVTRVIDALEQESSITECTSSGSDVCSREASCTIKAPMHKLQRTLEEALSAVTIAQLL